MEHIAVDLGAIVLDHRAIRCKRSECRGAVLTVTEERGGLARIALLNPFGRVRCAMDVVQEGLTLELRGCDEIGPSWPGHDPCGTPRAAS